MTSRITLPSTLARHIGGQKQVITKESTLGMALRTLTSEYSLGDALLTDEGGIQPYIRVVIGSRMLDKNELSDPDEILLGDVSVELKAAFAGG